MHRSSLARFASAVSAAARLRRMAVLMSWALFLAAACLASATSWAQVRATSSDQVVFPAGLQWQRMQSVSIHVKEAPHVRSENQALVPAVERIWSDEIERLLSQRRGHRETALVSQVDFRSRPVHFSLLTLLDFERCEPPLNGKDVVDMYDKCLARVAIGPVQRPHVIEFRDFCILNVDYDQNAPLEQNHTQFAFDQATSTAYFRVIQHGRFVPACNRSIRLEGLR